MTKVAVEKFWVYLDPQMSAMLTSGVWSSLVREDPDDQHYLPCVSIVRTDFGLLSLSVVVGISKHTDAKKAATVDVMIPPHWVAYVLGGDVQKKIGFQKQT